MKRIVSDKIAGWQDWLSVPESGRANLERNARQAAFQNAIRALGGIENDPQVTNIVQQIRALMQLSTTQLPKTVGFASHVNRRRLGG